METWTRHINGALALLQFRGEEQLRTPIGYQLFIHLRIQVVSVSNSHKALLADQYR